MNRKQSDELGVLPISKLLIKQAVPASIGILVMSLNIVIDSIFVGNWVGTIGIAAINVVLPVSFFVGALGMAIGIGGSSVISRALGSNDKRKATHVLGNQLVLATVVMLPLVVLGLIFSDSIIPSFGGKGEIFSPAKIYYTIVLSGVPLLGFSMLGNTVIRAEGKPKYAMVAMIIPTFSNLVLDYVLIHQFGMGMHGAAWATVGSYMGCLLYIIYFFLSPNSELKLQLKDFVLQKSLVREIASLGGVTLARQVITSVNYLILNKLLFSIGQEDLVIVYGIIGRTLMLALFPVFGVTQGFLPIAGYNYGAKKMKRVKQSIGIAIAYASAMGILVFAALMTYTEELISLFIPALDQLPETEIERNRFVATHAITPMRWVFLASPIIAIQLIGAAYFQAIGKAVPAFLLTISRQGFFFIPLLFILPKIYGETGVWIAFPLADILSTIVTAFYLYGAIKKIDNSPSKL